MSCRDHVRPRTPSTSRFGGTPYDALDRMLDAAQPDCVYVAVPPHRAVEIGQRLAARRFPFLTEKPLAADDPDGPQRLAAEVQRARLVAAVGYHLRALDIMAEVRQRLAAAPPQMVVARWLGGTPPPAWWGRAADGGGQVIEQATHLYDLARWLMGEAMVVGAASTRDPGSSRPASTSWTATAAVLQFESGAVGSFANTRRVASPVIEMEFVSDRLLTTLTKRPIAARATGTRRSTTGRSSTPSTPSATRTRSRPRRSSTQSRPATLGSCCRPTATRCGPIGSPVPSSRRPAPAAERAQRSEKPSSAASTSSSRFPNGSRT